MQPSRAVTETALLLKRYMPRFYASIRNNAPRRLRSAINERMTVDSLGTDNPKQVFSNIFAKNWWNNSESRSGWGAELKRTVSIRTELPEFVRRQSIHSLLDAPCGDFHWMQHVQWPRGFRYVGGDIVPDLIVENRGKYPGVDFMELDVLRDRLPDVDAWLARDLMIHFPDDAIRSARLVSIIARRGGQLLADWEQAVPPSRQIDAERDSFPAIVTAWLGGPADETPSSP